MFIFSSHISIKKSKIESLVVNKKGFVSIYGVIILSLCLTFVLMLTQRIKAQTIQNENLSYVELHAIKKAKESLNNDDASQKFSLFDFQIELKFNNQKCRIIVIRANEVVLKSLLVYDELDNYIISYEYID